MRDRQENDCLSRILRLGWEYARDAMFVADSETGVLVEMNPSAEKLLGYSRGEMIGRPQLLLHPEAEHSAILEAFRGAAAQSDLIPGFHILRKDGSVAPVEISASDVFEAEGRRLIIGVFRDVTGIVDRERRLAMKRWALEAYAGAALALMHARSSATLVQEICEAITGQSIFWLAWVGFAGDPPGKGVRITGAAGKALGYMDGLEVSWDKNLALGQGPTGIALRTGNVEVLGDMQGAKNFEPWCERARQQGLRSSITAPFSVGKSGRGVLVVYASLPNAFGAVETEVFTHLAEELGVGLHTLDQAERLEAERRERERAQHELRAAFEGIVGAMTTAMEVRDSYTAGHQRRVADLALAIAREMHWAEDRAEALRVAALVHDVGKIAIPAEILTKPAHLSPPEWALIQTHPEKGFEILKDVPFSWPIAEVVYQHHERLDGSGYPRGLSGDAILIGARILAVADTVESMATVRPYRAAQGLDAALQCIESLAGSKLDAEVVRICLALFRQQGYTFGIHEEQIETRGAHRVRAVL